MKEFRSQKKENWGKGKKVRGPGVKPGENTVGKANFKSWTKHSVGIMQKIVDKPKRDRPYHRNKGLLTLRDTQSEKTTAYQRGGGHLSSDQSVWGQQVLTHKCAKSTTPVDEPKRDKKESRQRPGGDQGENDASGEPGRPALGQAPWGRIRTMST